MIRHCSRCGAPVSAGAPCFCQRCGERLASAGTPGTMVCRSCGRTLTGGQSRFCDRCGSPLIPVTSLTPPPVPQRQLVVCPVCGSENRGDGIFFCKKCGSPFRKQIPVRKKDRDPDKEDLRGAMMNKPRNRETVNRTDAQGGHAGNPVIAALQTLKGHPRKILTGIAVIILLFAGIFLITSGSGSHGGGANNSTDSRTDGPLLPGGILYAGSDNSTLPDLLGAFVQERSAGQQVILNEAIPVIPDTPLNPKKT